MNTIYNIKLDSLYIKSKEGFNEEPIEKWSRQALEKIVYKAGKYYLGSTKGVSLAVLLNDEDSLVLTQKFPGGARIFNLNKKLMLIIITESSIHLYNKESLLAGDFSDTTFVYYGKYSIKKC
jgi:hypothetical protein